MIQLIFYRYQALILSWAIVLLVGCDLPQRPPLNPGQAEAFASQTRQSPTNDPDQVQLESPSVAFDGAWETWEAYFVGKRQVGYAHLQANPTIMTRGKSSDVRYELDSTLYVNQGPMRLLQRVTQSSTETSHGRLLKFEGVVRVGPAKTTFTGDVVDGRLKIETIRGAERSFEEMPWSDSSRGLIAIEQSLRRRPMTTMGEERVLEMLVPGQYQLATVKMRCVGEASVPLLDGKLHELLEINCDVRVGDGQPTFSTIWTTSTGEIARTHSPALQLLAYRTDQETATNFQGDDWGVASIPVTGELGDLSNTSRIGFRIQRTELASVADSDFRLPVVPGQYVREMGEQVTQVLVSRESEDLPEGFLAVEVEPTDADTASNKYLNFHHQKIHQFVSLVLTMVQETPRQIALALNQAVHENTYARPKAHGFRKASAIVEDLYADTTERAIFLAALLRERAIPARLAIGLKYAEGPPARLEYHVWTIAFVDDDWIHLDPTDGDIAAADRLVLSITDLSNNDEFKAVLPLLEAMQRMKVEIRGHN